MGSFFVLSMTEVLCVMETDEKMEESLIHPMRFRNNINNTISIKYAIIFDIKFTSNTVPINIFIIVLICVFNNNA